MLTENEEMPQGRYKWLNEKLISKDYNFFHAKYGSAA